MAEGGVRDLATNVTYRAARWRHDVEWSGEMRVRVGRSIKPTEKRPKAVWKVLINKLFRTYHPERHYMRGPGPKCGKSP
jgi:hypothetical protein